MNRLQQAWIWTRRIGHCRGFGIQSPSDYRFVRYVVNEHWPYYAYADMPANEGWLQRKLGRLYFRLANHKQPSTILDLVGVGQYLQTGCRKAHIITQFPDRNTAQVQLIIAPTETDWQQVMGCTTEETMLVVEGIGHDPSSWLAITGGEIAMTLKPSVTFDLYYCGIAQFNQQREKQNYIVNF